MKPLSFEPRKILHYLTLLCRESNLCVTNLDISQSLTLVNFRHCSILDIGQNQHIKNRIGVVLL